MSNFAANDFARDLAECVRLSQARKANLAAQRAASQANASLCTELLADAQRRGQSQIDWPEYFRNAYLCD